MEAREDDGGECGEQRGMAAREEEGAPRGAMFGNTGLTRHPVLSERLKDLDSSHFTWGCYADDRTPCKQIFGAYREGSRDTVIKFSKAT